MRAVRGQVKVRFTQAGKQVGRDRQGQGQRAQPVGERHRGQAQHGGESEGQQALLQRQVQQGDGQRQQRQGGQVRRLAESHQQVEAVRPETPHRRGAELAHQPVYAGETTEYSRPAEKAAARLAPSLHASQKSAAGASAKMAAATA